MTIRQTNEVAVTFKMVLFQKSLLVYTNKLHVAPFINKLSMKTFSYPRAEISSLNDKIRKLEVAQANQRRQQAIAMAALAAEKLNSQKLNGEFQSDSNLPNSANYGGSVKYNSRQRLAIPVGKRLLLKVIFLHRMA